MKEIIEEVIIRLDEEVTSEGFTQKWRTLAGRWIVYELLVATGSVESWIYGFVREAKCLPYQRLEFVARRFLFSSIVELFREVSGTFSSRGDELELKSIWKLDEDYTAGRLASRAEKHVLVLVELAGNLRCEDLIAIGKESTLQDLGRFLFGCQAMVALESASCENGGETKKNAA